MHGRQRLGQTFDEEEDEKHNDQLSQCLLCFLSQKDFAIGSKNTSYNLILLTLENKTWN